MEETARPTWLCPDEVDRERLLDMEPRLRRVRLLAMVSLAVALLVTAPWYGLWTLAPLAVAGLGFQVGEWMLPRVARPEYVIAGVWLVSQVMIAVSVALTGGGDSPAVAWLVIPVVTLSARFNGRGVAAGVVATALLMAAVTLGVESEAVWREPALLVAPLGLLVSVALLSTALMRSDVQYRTESLIDPLTGLLNRKALESRLEELREQARVTGDSVALVAGDIDHFKLVNDGHGHAMGDAVLADVAVSLRRRLRAFDLVYRTGGEEFLVLLPGSSTAEAAEFAEQLRAAIEREPHGGLPVTLSFGVAASEGGPFVPDEEMARADAALYAAKEAGRNRVHVAEPHAEPHPPLGRPHTHAALAASGSSTGA